MAIARLGTVTASMSRRQALSLEMVKIDQSPVDEVAHDGHEATPQVGQRVLNPRGNLGILMPLNQLVTLKALERIAQHLGGYVGDGLADGVEPRDLVLGEDAQDEQ